MSHPAIPKDEWVVQIKFACRLTDAVLFGFSIISNCESEKFTRRDAHRINPGFNCVTPLCVGSTGKQTITRMTAVLTGKNRGIELAASQHRFIKAPIARHVCYCACRPDSLPAYRKAVVAQ